MEFNPQSTQHISCLLFGGKIKYEVVEPMFDSRGNPEIIKSGLKQNQIKTHKVKKERFIKGFQLIPQSDWSNKTGYYSTKEEVLKKLCEDALGDAKEFLELMLLIRTKEKFLSTYYESVKKFVYPDSCVHPTYNHAATGTGRLSCSDPNVQNQPEDDPIVKQHFISRFEDGVIIEADYSGIEPRVEANLSGDIKKIQDVLDGVDDHTKNLALQFHRPYREIADLVESDKEWSRKRKTVKALTFTWQYGGGNKKAAKNSGLDIEEVKAIKQARMKEYPTLHLYYDYLKELVNKTGQYRDPWGKIYKFNRYPAKYQWQLEQGIEEDYIHTQIMNYRTQGFATGTLVLCMVGVFWRQRALYNRDKYLMVNTVHDSIVLDCRKEFIQTARLDLTILESAPIISLQEFNYEFKIDLPIKIKTGKTWADCQ